MWGFFIEILVFTFAALGIYNENLVERAIKRKLGLRERRLLLALAVVCAVLVSLNLISTTYTMVTGNSLVFCSKRVICVSESMQTNGNNGRLANVDLRTLCGHALSPNKKNWNWNESKSDYTSEVIRREISISGCRIALGIRSGTKDGASIVPKPTREAENSKNSPQFSSISLEKICTRALNDNGLGWSDTTEAQSYVSYLKEQEISLAACRSAVSIDSILYAENNQDPINLINTSSKKSNFPLRTMRNGKWPYTNVRSGPGTASKIVGRLDNGTKVAILGAGNSPKSGHLYCLVVTKNGTNGYVDNDMVDGDCTLTAAQKISAATMLRNGISGLKLE